MPFTNLKSSHFDAAEQTRVNDFLTSLEETLSPKLAVLTGEERQRYGSINETNKLIVNKVHDFKLQQPTLASPDVDWKEFESDFTSRQFLEGVISRLQKLIIGLDCSKILHDWDNYQASLVDYGYAQYRMGAGIDNFENKVNEMKQFFKPAATAPKAK